MSGPGTMSLEAPQGEWTTVIRTHCPGRIDRTPHAQMGMLHVQKTTLYVRDAALSENSGGTRTESYEYLQGRKRSASPMFCAARAVPEHATLARWSKQKSSFKRSRS